MKAKKLNSFYDETYTIPTALLKNENQITIQFVADSGNTTGGFLTADWQNHKINTMIKKRFYCL
ncbi:hypothetical protein ACQ9BO_18185 [Flavobacterium sp. P21]|uniref:hypothetical protein n=1 Tax=Flavobacterium sp. P21 TaxID=3423948 RepID=UPI003D677BA0